MLDRGWWIGLDLAMVFTYSVDQQNGLIHPKVDSREDRSPQSSGTIGGCVEVSSLCPASHGHALEVVAVHYTVTSVRLLLYSIHLFLNAAVNKRQEMSQLAAPGPASTFKYQIS